MGENVIILGLESSCDETAAAIVTRSDRGSPEILSNKVLSQTQQHAQFGGVVPEIAARAHLEAMDHLIEAAMGEARVSFGDIDAIAVTAGPGLVGGLMVGVSSAQGLSTATGIPVIAINHLEGHALSGRLSHCVEFPFLLLLVSGGHSQIIEVNGLGDYHRLASTIDDAVGEAFDKTAKLLSLGFPGGPQVEQAAKEGDPERFDFPHPLKGDASLNMSFSGLKTAVRLTAQKLAPLSQKDVADICASFQKAVGVVLVDRVTRAMASFEARNGKSASLVVAGGVAANTNLRQKLVSCVETQGWEFVAPPLQLCGDNAAMIAWAGLEHYEAGERGKKPIEIRSRWPLDEQTHGLVGGGKRGVKA